MEENGGRGWRGKKSIKGKVLQKQMNGNFLNILLSIYLNRKYNQLDLLSWQSVIIHRVIERVGVWVENVEIMANEKKLSNIFSNNSPRSWS